jgi:hypothetical protein
MPVFRADSQTHGHIGSSQEGSICSDLSCSFGLEEYCVNNTGETTPRMNESLWRLSVSMLLRRIPFTVMLSNVIGCVVQSVGKSDRCSNKQLSFCFEISVVADKC